MPKHYQKWVHQLAALGAGGLRAVYPLYRNLTLKSLLAFALGIIAVTLVLLAVSVRNYHAFQQAQAAQRFQNFVQEEAARLNGKIGQLVESLQRLKSYVLLLEEGGEGGGIDMPVLQKLMAANLESHALQHNNFFALEPAKARQYFGQDAYLAILYKSTKDPNQADYNRLENQRLKIWKDGNYLTNVREYWYHINKDSPEVQATSAYFDKNYMNAWVFSVTQGLYDKNQFYGMVGVDVLIDAFFLGVENLALGESGGAFLVDAESGMLLTRTDQEERAGTLFAGYPRMQYNLYTSAQEKAPWREIFAGGEEPSEVRGQDGSTYMLSAVRLNTLPWALVVYQHSGELRAEYATTPYVLAGLVILLAGGVFVLLFVYRLRQPLQALVATARDLKDQNPLTPIPNLGGMPELQVLRESINNVVLLANLSNEQNEACNRQLENYRHQVLEQSKQIEDREGRLTQITLELQKTKGEHQKSKTRFQELQGKALKLKAYAQKAVLDAHQSKIEAEQANRTKRQFLSNMSHELRTPMNAIIGYTEILQEDAEELGYYDFLPDLQKIHGASYHMLDLINNLFDLSKIESSRMDLYLETFDIAPVIQDVAATVQPLVEKQSNILKVKLDSALGTMNADLTKVRQNLLNLLSNASKFTKQGIISLSAVRESVTGEDWIIFEVSDQGIGMTQEQIQKLFQAFNLMEGPSPARQYGGTGLGLVITKQFCEIMGGNIAVASEFGKGSTFTIRLPADVGSALAKRSRRV